MSRPRLLFATPWRAEMEYFVEPDEGVLPRGLVEPE
jgi:hypothetical protein